jgi:hypothetical protein
MGAMVVNDRRCEISFLSHHNHPMQCAVESLVSELEPFQFPDDASPSPSNTGLAEVDIAVAARLKAHHVLHDPMKPLRIADQKVRRSEEIREVGENW